MRSRIFLYKIQFRTTVFEAFFSCDAYFWQRSSVKPATHYTSLFANNEKTTFLRKKLSFTKRDKKWSTHYQSNPSFRECVQKQKIGQKKFFEFVKKPPTLVNAFREKVFHEMLTNLTKHSLHTIRVSHGFHQFNLFSSLFANSVQWA